MRKSSIRSKILISIIGITLFTALAIAAVFYEKSVRMIEQNYITTLKQRIRLTADTIDNVLLNVCNIDIKASCDEEIRAQLEQYNRDGDENRLEALSDRMRIFAKMDSAISSLYLIIPQKNLIVTTLDYPVYRSGVEAEKLQNFQKNIQEDLGPVILEDLVHNDEKFVTFAEPVTDTQGNTLAYLCANISENSLSYSYFAEPLNENLSQICLVYHGEIVASGNLSAMGKKFDQKQYGKWMKGTEVTGADRKNIYPRLFTAQP